MTKQQYLDGLKSLRLKYEEGKLDLMKRYAIANNPYVEGDIVTDHIGSIKIGKLSLALVSDTPCYIYRGVILNKDGSPNKLNKVRDVCQSNLI